MKYLVIDKKQRLETKNQYPYTIERIFEELDKKKIPYDFAYNHEISIESTNNSLKILAGGKNVVDYSHVMMRGHYTYLEYEIKRMIVDHIDFYNQYNPENKILVQNGRFIKKLHHYSKLSQMAICAQNGINYLNSFYKADGDYEENTGSIIQYPKIAKHYSGKKDIREVNGKLKTKKNLFLIKNADDYKQEYLAEKKLGDFFIQEFTSVGEDYRIFMKGTNVIGGWKRKAKDSFITVSDGEYSMYNEPEKDIADLSIKTAEVFESDFMAIDIMRKDDKPYVLEVNMNPGFKAYETKIEGTPVNIPLAMVEAF